MKPFALPGQHEYDGQAFPLGIDVATESLYEACAWATGAAPELSRLAGEHGAVLVRGLPLAKPEEFDEVVSALGYPNFSYADSLSNAYRINHTPRVFSANEAPAEVTIFLHHEMAQTPFYPSKLIFFCQVAAEEGGATPVCRSDILWERLKVEYGAFGGLRNQGTPLYQRHAGGGRRRVRDGAQLAKHPQRRQPRGGRGALGQARLHVGLAGQR